MRESARRLEQSADLSVARPVPHRQVRPCAFVCQDFSRSPAAATPPISPLPQQRSPRLRFRSGSRTVRSPRQHRGHSGRDPAPFGSIADREPPMFAIPALGRSPTASSKPSSAKSSRSGRASRRPEQPGGPKRNPGHLHQHLRAVRVTLRSTQATAVAVPPPFRPAAMLISLHDLNRGTIERASMAPRVAARAPRHHCSTNSPKPCGLRCR